VYFYSGYFPCGKLSTLNSVTNFNPPVGNYKRKMIISTKCKNCKETIHYKTNSSDKVEFTMKKGEFVELQCKKCGMRGKYHIDSFYAKSNKLSLIIATIIFLLGTPIALYLVWNKIINSGCVMCIAIIIIPIIVPSLIYGIIMKNDRIRVNAFNRHKLKRP